MFEEKDNIFEEENQKILTEQIQNAPDCKIFGGSRFSKKSLDRSMCLSCLLPMFITILLVVLIENLILLIVAFVIEFAFSIVAIILITYLSHSNKFLKTYVSESGIAKESKREKVAIPWDNIEYIEIKYKGSNIDYIIFRSGTISLTYTNSSFAIRLPLDLVSEYVGGIERWHMFDDIKENSETTECDILYMNPDIDKSEGLKKFEDILLRECLGEQDYDAEQTQEHTSAKSDDELYELISNDPQCECLVDSGNFARFIGNFKVIPILIVVAIAASIGGIFIVQDVVLVYSFVGILFALAFYGLIKGGEKLVISPIGIARFIFGSPEAIEWQHVEYIDFSFEEDDLVQVEFFGNKRRIFCPERTYKHLLSMDLMRKYIYDLDEWKKINQNSWGEGSYRLIRPDV